MIQGRLLVVGAMLPPVELIVLSAAELDEAFPINQFLEKAKATITKTTAIVPAISAIAGVISPVVPLLKVLRPLEALEEMASPAPPPPPPP
jgi:hypothetical protein